MSRRRRRQPPPAVTVVEDPWLVRQALAAGTPIGQAMHEYNQARLHAVLRPDEIDTPTTEENQMTTTENGQTPRGMVVEDLAEAHRRIAMLTEKVSELETKLEIHHRQVRELFTGTSRAAERIAELENQLAPKPKRDELAEKLLAWMNQYPGLMLSPTAIWMNCGGEEALGVGNDRVADKLAQLARREQINVFKEDGRNALYAGKVQ